MGIVSSLPVQRVKPVLALPLWLGTLRDHSGYGNHPTAVAPLHWQTTDGKDGVQSPTAGYLTIPADASLAGHDALTVFVAADFRTQITNSYILRDAANSIYIYLSSGKIRIYDGAGSPWLNVDVIGAKSLAVTFAPGEKCEAFLDGVSAGLFHIISNLTTALSIWRVGGSGGTNGAKNAAQAMVVYPATLTDPEILSLHEWSQQRFSPRKQWPGGGLDIPTLAGNAQEPGYLDNIQTARVSLANESSGQISNSGYRIDSGTWRVNEETDTGNRYIECIADGMIYRDNIEAYGTWDIEFQKANASDIRACMIKTDVPIASGNAYYWIFNGAEKIQLYELGVGDVFATGDDFLDHSVRNTVRLTRSAAGDFVGYIKGGRYTDWTAIGNGNDATLTTSRYVVFQMDVGDRLYADSQFAGVMVP